MFCSSDDMFDWSTKREANRSYLFQHQQSTTFGAFVNGVQDNIRNIVGIPGGFVRVVVDDSLAL